MRAYKFLPAELALRDLVEHRIKISEHDDMNDPVELLGARLSEPDVERVVRNHLRSLGALCFSRGWSNPLLWSHYADKHKGICLGFDVSPSLLMEPFYVESQQELDAGVLLEAIPAGWSHGAEEVIKRKLLTKFKAWSYEDEVRLITSLDEKDGDHYFYSFDENLRLCEVVAGVRCSIPRRRIEETLTGYSELVKILKARLSFTPFEVVEDTDGFPVPGFEC